MSWFASRKNLFGTWMLVLWLAAAGQLPSPAFGAAGEGGSPLPDSQVEASIEDGEGDGEKVILREIRRFASLYDLDPHLLEAIARVESQLDPEARSSRGAMGLMQITRRTARHLGVDDPFDVEESLDAGARYLKRLLKRYRGNVRLALAAYNAGPTAVRRHRGVPPYRETRRYLRKVLREYRRIAARSGAKS